MSNPLTQSIADQLARLRTAISCLNKKGNLQGLFSCHILSDSPDIGLEWVVACNDDEWLESDFDKNNLYQVAALGYSMDTNKNIKSKGQSIFIECIENISKRDHFSGTHMSFPFQPITFLGLVLGTRRITKDEQRGGYEDWLITVLKERRKKGNISNVHAIFYKYIESLLTKQKVIIEDLSRYLTLDELSFIEWGHRRSHFLIPDVKNALKKIRTEILESLITTDLTLIAPELSAQIWSAANKTISKGVEKIVESPSKLRSLLKKFPAAMKRWRFDGKSLKNSIKWPVRNEREVQDIIWLMLRPYYDDLIDEESLRKLGHSSYKPDFAVPSLRTLLEVKYIRASTEFKKTEKEVMEDSIGYLLGSTDYEKLIVFIYDHSCSTQEHDETIRALKKISNIEDVIIVSRPSQLPL